jgi:hypothetical protein
LTRREPRPIRIGRVTRTVLLSALIFALCSGGLAPAESLAASAKIKLNYKSKTVVAGTALTLKFSGLKKTETKKVKYQTKNGKTKYKKVKDYPKITWKSSNSAVATVKNGKVTAIRYGNATITAQFKRKNDKKAKVYTCKITVNRPAYVVDPSTKPLAASGYEKAAAYNAYTKNYYMLRSYVEDIEKRGGGTLTLLPGEYSVTNVVYIPSDTKIYLSDGVLIKNANETHTSRLKATKTVFHFCAPSKGLASAKYTGSKLGEYKSGYTGYDGVHDSAIIGLGNATIDMQSVADRYGAVMVHARNISVQSVAFTNILNGHGIEVNASTNVSIMNCAFVGDANATSKLDEGINIDTADLETGGISAPYSSYDRTACSDVTIQNCIFTNLPCAVGSHTYSEGSPHLRINVIGNTIQNTFSNAISAMYWENSLIQNNVIDGVMGNKYGISGGGAINLTVTGNTFANMFRIAEFFVYETAYYSAINAEMSEAALYTIMNGNAFINVTNLNIRMEPSYDANEFYFPPEPDPNTVMGK